MLIYSLAEVTIVKYPKRVSKEKFQHSVECGDLIQDVIEIKNGIYEGYVEELNAYIQFKIE